MCSSVKELTTHFAPAERATGGEIRADHEKLRNAPLIRQLLDSFPEPAMLLNPQRQIVLGNDKLLALLGAGMEAILGLRPGEMLNCIHAKDEQAGCGTSKFCSQCGAVSAIWESSRTNTAQVRECRITCRSATGFSSLDLRVWGHRSHWMGSSLFSPCVTSRTRSVVQFWSGSSSMR